MQITKEGKAKAFIYPGEATKKLTVFYNPEMEEHRNLTISVLNSYFQESFLALDALAGCGIRGIRIIKETKGNVVFNDVATDSYNLIKSNLELNKIEAEAHKEDARTFMFKERGKYDYIDIDPFGSPSKFFEASAFALKNNGIFAATATDTGALAGSFKGACLRRYGVHVCRTDFMKELGIRVLITAIKNSFARYDASFHPLVCFSNHFFRVWGKVSKGKLEVNKDLEKIGFVSYCQKCLNREFSYLEKCSNCGNKNNVIGPIWLGEIQDKGFIKKVTNEQEKNSFKKTFMDEIGSPLYFDVHKLCGLNSMVVPKFEKIIFELEKKGFEASRSNLSPKGLKTNAGIKDLTSCIRYVVVEKPK